MRAREIQAGMPVIIDHNTRNTGIVVDCIKIEGYRYSYCNVICKNGNSNLYCVNRLSKYTNPIIRVRRTFTVDMTSAIQRLREESQRIIMYNTRC